ncbi:hypothetical protein K1T35_31505 [Pseudonocardia sp. DSM 110487]|nr:hypothetical protein [Pseudonocardia sp. DSM 110487]QYN33039.1 hypothetical protein K1T35_31505 [Pseudonocardia sp. DSM 110487]
MTIRWALHPVTAAVALVVVAVAAGKTGGVALLLVAGAAAGFANSGST